MSRSILLVSISLAFISMSLRAQPTRQATPERLSAQTPVPNKPGWTLTFHDEFDGTKLDTKKWLDCYPGGERTHSNNEQQYYATDGYDLKGGLLRFKAE